MILTAENYYGIEADKEYFSVSQVKRFLECEEAALDELLNPTEEEKTEALLVGGYVDAHFSGEMERFRAENPEIFKRDGSLKVAYRKAEDIIARIEGDKLSMMMLAGEKQQIMTGEICGAPFKIKPDVLLSAGQMDAVAQAFPGMSEYIWAGGAIVDLKIVRDFEPLYRKEEGRMSFIEYWRYDLQLAVYQEIVRQVTGAKLPCFILAATKQDVPGLALIPIEQAMLDFNLEWLKQRMPRLIAVKKGEEEADSCGECAHCRRTHQLSGPSTFIDGRLMIH